MNRTAKAALAKGLRAPLIELLTKLMDPDMESVLGSELLEASNFVLVKLREQVDYYGRG